MLLTGQFDIHIIHACNLSCKNCSVLDFKFGDDQEGKNVNTFMTYEQVVKQVELIKKWGYQLETLKILGGEPTTHPKFPEIVDFLMDSKVAKEVWVNTNGLNFSEKVISACSKLDKVLITLYPLVNTKVDQLTAYRSSGISNRFQRTHINLMTTFEKFGVGLPNVEYTQEGNWKMCWSKNDCRTIVGDTMYQCNVSYAKRVEGRHISEWGDKLDTMLNLCAKCPYPPKLVPWSSLNIKKDQRNLNKGLKFWQQHNNTIKIKEI
ncbi:radical SAM protein [bacterium]|nr:radical SAM protein [bacterium]